jgi:hypothetical protein
MIPEALKNFLLLHLDAVLGTGFVLWLVALGFILTLPILAGAVSCMARELPLYLDAAKRLLVEAPARKVTPSNG